MVRILQTQIQWRVVYKYSRKACLKLKPTLVLLELTTKNVVIFRLKDFILGGDGMQQWAMDGRETIALRGYKNQSLSSRDGSYCTINLL